MSNASGRFSELDGLRGISILLVLLGHSVPKNFILPDFLLPTIDGALGVRIFFVISGFIITALLVKEKTETGSIDWKSFFLRRFTKLLPSLWGVIFVVAALSSRLNFQCSQRSFWNAAFFLTEIFGTDCWQLSHTWSLSTEEIFYLSWLPAVLLLKTNNLTRILLAVLILSPVVRVLDYLNHFESPFLRNADLLAWGSLAAMALENEQCDRVLKQIRGFSGVFGSICLLLIYLSSFPIHEIPELKWLSYFGVPFRPTLQALATGLLILWLRTGRNSIIHRILASPPLVRLGVASYSLYLWQQLIIPNPFGTSWAHKSQVVASFFYFCATLFFGVAVYVFFEKPTMLKLRALFKLSSDTFSGPFLSALRKKLD